jgi:hypothetical protein
MVLYDYNSIAILSKPLKTCQASELTTTWTKLHTQPNLHIFSKERFDDLKKAFTKYNIVDFQRVSPHIYKRDYVIVT